MNIKKVVSLILVIIYFFVITSMDIFGKLFDIHRDIDNVTLSLFAFLFIIVFTFIAVIGVPIAIIYIINKDEK